MSLESTVLKIKCHQLRLADTVKLFDGAFGYATVKKIDSSFVYFERPFTHTADFSYSGGVICYTGIENFQRSLDDDGEFEVVERKKLDL